MDGIRLDNPKSRHALGAVLTVAQLLAIVKRFRWQLLFVLSARPPGAQRDWRHAPCALFGYTLLSIVVTIPNLLLCGVRTLRTCACDTSYLWRLCGPEISKRSWPSTVFQSIGRHLSPVSIRGTKRATTVGILVLSVFCSKGVIAPVVRGRTSAQGFFGTMQVFACLVLVAVKRR